MDAIVPQLTQEPYALPFFDVFRDMIATNHESLRTNFNDLQLGKVTFLSEALENITREEFENFIWEDAEIVMNHIRAGQILKGQRVLSAFDQVQVRFCERLNEACDQEKLQKVISSLGI